MIIFGLLFLALFFALSFYFYSLVVKFGAEQQYTVSKNSLDRTKIENEGNYWMGASNPKITIVEFSDFTCPFCKNSYPTIRDIILKYNKDVKLIYRDYPIKQEYAADLAMAGRCAGEQGLFWPMHDKLFQNQGVSAKEDIFRLANQIGVNAEKFKTCFEEKKYLPLIQKDYADATDLEIKGTPTWFVNGYKIEGDVPKDVWEKIINELLKN